MKLRLLTTEVCLRNCAGCCNNYWDLGSLRPVTTLVRPWGGWDEILLTGGEPLLFPVKLFDLIDEIKLGSGATPVYLYTSNLASVAWALGTLAKLDGMTVTLHEQEDVDPYIDFARVVMNYPKLAAKSLRLNVFREVGCFPVFPGWEVRPGIVWDKDCPLPEDEVFMRLAEPWR